MPDEKGIEKLPAFDCGVCGIPASRMEVVCPGYAVPRCDGHAGDQPYQAESRLEQAEKRLEELREWVQAEATRYDNNRSAHEAHDESLSAEFASGKASAYGNVLQALNPGEESSS